MIRNLHDVYVNLCVRTRNEYHIPEPRAQVLHIVLALLEFELELVLEHTRSWHMLGMLSGSLEEKNRVMALAGLEILGELGVLLMNEEPKVRKSPLRP